LPDESNTKKSRRDTAHDTRENIINIAMEEFSQKGLAGARIDEIAERPASQEQSSRFEDLPPEEALRAMVGHNFDYHYEHPEFVRLVMNENLHHGEHINQIESMKTRNRSVIDQLGAILAKGEKSGVFRAGIDPVDLHIAISALSFYNVANRYTFLCNFDVDFAKPATRARRREQIVQIVMSWVKPA